MTCVPNSPLPPREQARRLAAVAASLVTHIVKSGIHAPEADAALAAIRGWSDGADLTGRYFSEPICSEDERGTLRRLSEAAGKPSESGWNALTTTTMYVAWLVFREPASRCRAMSTRWEKTALTFWTSNWPDSAEQREKAWSSSKSSESFGLPREPNEIFGFDGCR